MTDSQPPDWAPEPPPEWPPPPPDGFAPPSASPLAGSPGRAAGSATSRPAAASTGFGDGAAQPYRDPAAPLDAANPGPPPPPPPPPRRRGGACLVIILVLAAVLVLGIGGCVWSCRGALSQHYSTGVWGWTDGAGPSLESGATTMFGAAPEPRDTAPPDASKDALAEAGLRRIHAGFRAFEKAEGRRFDGSRDGSWEVALQPYVAPWPQNPWTGEPMHGGRHRGDVDYDQYAPGDLRVYVSP